MDDESHAGTRAQAGLRISPVHRYDGGYVPSAQLEAGVAPPAMRTGEDSLELPPPAAEPLARLVAEWIGPGCHVAVGPDGTAVLGSDDGAVVTWLQRV